MSRGISPCSTILHMITRYSGCRKRVCTLISTHRTIGSAERVQWNRTTVNRELSSSEHYHDQQRFPRDLLSLSGLFIGFMAVKAKEREDPPEEETTPEQLPLDPPPPPQVLPLDPPPPPQVLAYLDNLYDTQQYLELRHSLERYKDLNNAEVLWRRARAEWEWVGLQDKRNKTAEMQPCVDLIDQALAADETNSNVHRWKAIISNAYCSSIGMKQQILNLETMKYHLERAIELNPGDATVLTLMGSWHTELLDLGWYQRKFASTFLAALPECSYEEALELFLRAEELAPGAWNRNLLLIGKTYFHLGDKWKAKHYIELTLDKDAVTDDDKSVLEDAEKFYRKHFVLTL